MSSSQDDMPPSLGDQDVIEDLDPLGPPSAPPAQLPASKVTSDDLEFVERAFAQVEHVDFRAPTTPPKGRLTGIDKKLFDLREQVRRLERELARVGYIWKQKQEDIRGAEQLVRAKDAEVKNRDRTISNLQGDVAHQVSVTEAKERMLREQAEEVEREKKLRLEIGEKLSEVEAATAKALSAKEAELRRSRTAYDALKELSQGYKETSRDKLLAARLQKEDLRDRLTVLELQATTRMRDALAQAAACRGLQNELDAVVQERTALQAEIERMQADAHEAQEGSQVTRAQLENERDDIIGRLQESEARIESLEQQLADQSNEQASFESRESELKAELTKAQTELERAHSSGAANKAALDRLRTEAEKQQREQEERIDELLKAREVGERELTNARSSLTDAESSQSEAEAALSQSSELVDSLKRRIAELEGRLESSTDELQQKSKSLSALEHESQELAERLRLSERDRSSLAERVGQLEAT